MQMYYWVIALFFWVLGINGYCGDLNVGQSNRLTYPGPTREADKYPPLQNNQVMPSEQVRETDRYSTLKNKPKPTTQLPPLHWVDGSPEALKDKQRSYHLFTFSAGLGPRLVSSESGTTSLARFATAAEYQYQLPFLLVIGAQYILFEKATVGVIGIRFNDNVLLSGHLGRGPYGTADSAPASVGAVGGGQLQLFLNNHFGVSGQVYTNNTFLGGFTLGF